MDQMIIDEGFDKLIKEINQVNAHIVLLQDLIKQEKVKRKV